MDELIAYKVNIRKLAGLWLRFAQYWTTGSVMYTGGNMKPIKYCPFCGSGEGMFITSGTPDREGTPICWTCDQCGAKGPWTYAKDLDDIGKATEYWNARKYIDQELKRIVDTLQWFQDERPPGDGAVQEAIDGLKELMGG